VDTFGVSIHTTTPPLCSHDVSWTSLDAWSHTKTSYTIPGIQISITTLPSVQLPHNWSSTPTPSRQRLGDGVKREPGQVGALRLEARVHAKRPPVEPQLQQQLGAV